MPSLHRFLAEEDVVRELRAENPRLINYLCQPSILHQLLQKCFDIPPVAAPQQFATAVTHQPPAPPSPQSPSAHPAQPSRDTQLKYAYVACELLTSENKSVSAAFVADDQAISQLFAVLERTPPGQLELLVFMNFSKIFLTILKIEGVPFLHKLSTRPSFLPVFLKHMDCDAISELLVNILDASDNSFDDASLRRPTDEALKLLEDADLMGGLSHCFVLASTEAVHLPSQQQPQQQQQPSQQQPQQQPQQRPQQEREPQHVNTTRAVPSDAPHLYAKHRRMREETMANVASTILGVTERLLQLPELGVRIPLKLCPFTNPQVVSRILDAGLYAYSNSMVDANGVPRALGEPATNEQRVEAFSNLNSSALLHSLALAANLMTLEANVYRDEDMDAAAAVFGQGTSARPATAGVGKMASHKGFGPSIVAAYAAAKAETSERQQALKSKPLPEMANKKAGDLLVDTLALERELALRFPRLSEMLDEHNDDEQNHAQTGPVHRPMPLGSLRLKVAEFFVACMKNASPETIDQIMSLGVPKKLLALFSKYRWSSMLHGIVMRSIGESMYDDLIGRSARKAWFEAGVIPWLIESWAQNEIDEEEDEQQSHRTGSRAGYMGHLIRIGTSLKYHIIVRKDEHDEQREVRHELEQSQIDKFKAFDSEVLSAAVQREMTPLCDLRYEDEAEATDLLEMSGMTFSDHFGDGSGSMQISLMQNPPKPGDEIMDEDEEIRPVDVDDLEQFAADDDDDDDDEEARNAKPVDHDIPEEMRERLSREEEVEVIKPVRDPVPVGSTSKTRRLSKENSHDRSQKAYMSKIPESRDTELEEVIDTVDSSSDDDGTYEAFVDTRTKSMMEATDKLEALKVADNEPGSASLDGAVTEIEEESLPLSSDNNLMQLASNVISVVDETADSSDDEEYVEWNDTGRVDVAALSQQSSRSNEPEKGGSRASSAR
eukprot:gb/GEZJ01001237.1/.p2 GENE.gb/GEZJ01001237.1/~~gb/GEZJ01001237.1/.p2  ORF type:complete len:979 (+),score=236.38 gb/GEZJ01001237.1/:96-2939(+)